jgi:hypothetical protein
VHFHIPLHADVAPPLAGTHEVLVRTLMEMFTDGPAVTDHVEVETYTWQVLPGGERPRDARELVRGIAAELGWAREELVRAGLEAAS